MAMLFSRKLSLPQVSSTMIDLNGYVYVHVYALCVNTIRLKVFTGQKFHQAQLPITQIFSEKRFHQCSKGRIAFYAIIITGQKICG